MKTEVSGSLRTSIFIYLTNKTHVLFSSAILRPLFRCFPFFFPGQDRPLIFVFQLKRVKSGGMLLNKSWPLAPNVFGDKQLRNGAG